MKGYTLIELIVVAGIILTTMLILAPQVCNVKVKIAINDQQSEDTWSPMEWTPDEQSKVWREH